ncbi:hypothetical protein [Yokenella regensburgei]|uniref:hypothetical protein n=1 Tax=Yokenella regensburgei TaxID=158877 RepID=UPI001432BC98|nr:hypothetical protein [Yokenella regensburgei]QIU89831.1 hypothetical protein HEC60_11180 [Yokenella regensburgei]
MPIELNNIPQKVPLPSPPNKLRWLVIIITIIVLGALGTLFFWPSGMPAYSGWFWFCFLGLPVLAGLSCYAFRLHRYEARRDHAYWWNHLQQHQHEQHVLMAQRAAGVLGMSYVTPVACNHLATALVQGACVLRSAYAPSLSRTVTCAQLSPPVNKCTESEYQQRLVTALTRVFSTLQPELSLLAAPVTVRIRHDGIINKQELADIWRNLLPAQHNISTLTILTDDDGVMWLDKWLDEKKPQALLSVEINLFRQPRDDQAESVSALLLVSPEWWQENPVKLHSKIHRPVEDNGNQSAVIDAALWGLVEPGTHFELWRSPLQNNAFGTFLKNMEEASYLSGMQGDYLIGDTFGHPGVAVGNIALICASGRASSTGEPQWVLLEDGTRQQIIIRPIS